MSVLANGGVASGPSQGTHELLLIIAETLNDRFPDMANPTPGAFDTEEELLYKIALIVGNIPSTGGAAPYSGSGSPEGVLAAPPGSLYTDVDGPGFYQKITGTGSTGWNPTIT